MSVSLFILSSCLSFRIKNGQEGEGSCIQNEILTAYCTFFYTGLSLSFKNEIRIFFSHKNSFSTFDFVCNAFFFFFSLFYLPNFTHSFSHSIFFSHHLRVLVSRPLILRFFMILSVGKKEVGIRIREKRALSTMQFIVC